MKEGRVQWLPSKIRENAYQIDILNIQDKNIKEYFTPTIVLNL